MSTVEEMKEDLLKFLKDAGILEEARNSYADSLMSDSVYVDIIVDLTREELENRFKISYGDVFRITRHAAKLKEQKAVPVVQQEDQQQSNTPLQQLEVAERPVSCEWLRKKLDPCWRPVKRLAQCAWRPTKKGTQFCFNRIGACSNAVDSFLERKKNIINLVSVAGTVWTIAWAATHVANNIQMPCSSVNSTHPTGRRY